MAKLDVTVKLYKDGVLVNGGNIEPDQPGGDSGGVDSAVLSKAMLGKMKLGKT